MIAKQLSNLSQKALQLNFSVVAMAILIVLTITNLISDTLVMRVKKQHDSNFQLYNLSCSLSLLVNSKYTMLTMVYIIKYTIY